jgi:putative phage-type endonuclease
LKVEAPASCKEISLFNKKMDVFILDLLVIKLMKSKKRDAAALSERFRKMLPHSFEYITERVLMERLFTIHKYQEIKRALDMKPVIEQRTPEWYELRNGMLTASDWGQALGLGKFGTVTQIYHKKCGYGDEKAFDSDAPPLKWGVRYEPVACQIYSLKSNSVVSEYGVIQHPKYSFLGASPDGITNLGVMLEIKCVYKRKMDGKIPDQYMCQIQGQLEICDLEECDYFECEFKEVDSLQALRSVESPYKGIILKDKRGEYRYGDVNDLCTLATYDEDEYVNVYYYYMQQHLLKRVQRDRGWFEENLPKLRQVWDNVLRYRKNFDDYCKEVRRPRPPKFNLRTDSLVDSMKI